MIKSSSFFLSIAFFISFASFSTVNAQTPLNGISDQDTRVGYCYYSMAQRLTALSKNKDRVKMLTILPEISSWQKMIKELFHKRNKKSRALANALSVYNAAVKAEMIKTKQNKQQAVNNVLQIDLANCKAELVVQQKRLRTILLAEKKQKEVKNAEAAKQLEFSRTIQLPKGKEIFVWQIKAQRTSQSLAHSVDLAIWKNKAGQLTGLAKFIMGVESCTGYLVPVDKTRNMQLKPVAGEICKNHKGSQFIIQWQPKLNKNLIYWARINRQNRDAKSKYVYKPRGPSKFVSIKREASSLKELLDEIKITNKTPIEVIKLAEIKHENQVKSIKELFNKQYKNTFPEADLLGVWKGNFATTKKVVPVEVAFWTSKAYSLYQVVGLIYSKKRDCVTVLVANKFKQDIYLITDNRHVVSGYKTCGVVHTKAYIYLNKPGTEVVLYFSTESKGFNPKFKRPCIKGLKRPGCFYLGHLKRTAASAKISEVMKSIKFKNMQPPKPEIWASLQKSGPTPQHIKKAHNKLAAMNKQILANMMAARKATKVKLHADWARQAEPIIAKRRAAAARRARAEAYRNRGGDKIAQVVKGPFDAIDGGSFLNAIYHGNANAVRQQTRAYHSTKIRQRRKFLGGAHWSDRIQNAGFRAIRLTTVVSGLYLFNYQNYYKSCLKKDAVTFTKTTKTPGSKTYNLRGWEIARTYSSTNVDKYTVNIEFAALFRRIWRTNPENLAMGIADLLMGGGGLNLPKAMANADPHMAKLVRLLKGRGKKDLRNQLLSGTKEMMRKFKCDSPQIKQFERNLRKLMNMEMN